MHFLCLLIGKMQILNSNDEKVASSGSFVNICVVWLDHLLIELGNCQHCITQLLVNCCLKAEQGAEQLSLFYCFYYYGILWGRADKKKNHKNYLFKELLIA